MKSLGIVRRVDALGRVVLPKELRDTRDLPEGTPMEIFVDGEAIVLKKYSPGCVFCGSIDDSFDADTFKGKDICGKCREDLRKRGA
jgi:transcriptional pleiotropic regulator of transition state genes